MTISTLLYAFRTRNQARTTCCTKRTISTPSSGKDEYAHMDFSKFSKYSDSRTIRDQSLHSLHPSDRNDFALKDSDLSSSDSDHFRRARLSGESLNVVPSLVAKSNSNLSKAGDEKYLNNNNKNNKKAHADIV